MKLWTLTAAAAGSLLFAGPASAQNLPLEQVNALEGLFGKHAGARRSGAKGVCASGYFVGDAVGRSSQQRHRAFSGEKVPVVLRFSVGGGSPKASDKGRCVRGLALQFTAAER